MIEKLFPKTADNHYSGHWLAKWLLIFYVFKSFVTGSIHLYAPGLATVHTPPGVMMDNILVPLVLVMLVLSLWERKV